MRRILNLTLAAALLAAALSGCSQPAAQESETPSRTPEELTEAYQTAIESARDDEMNEAVPVITASDQAMADLVLPMLGITNENTTAYAVAVSPMNVKAYGVAALMPAEGQEDALLESVNAFVEQQKSAFTNYLPDQYEIASAAKVETLDDGTILLVMCEEQDTVLESIKTSLNG